MYLLGASNPETIRMINSIQKSEGEKIVFAGMLDNDKSKIGTDFYGLKVVGGTSIIPEINNEETRFVNLITRDTQTRYRVTSDIVSYGGRLGNFIHPNIDLTLVKFGVGNYFQESVVLQANVHVGDNSSIHMGSLIGHETKIGNSVFIAHGVSISGCCDIGDGVFIGTNATVLPRIKIGRWAKIGAGAVVTKDVPEFATVVGNPARIIVERNDNFTLFNDML